MTSASASVSQVRPLSVGEMLLTSSWLLLVLASLQTTWIGFVVAAVLVRGAWWRVVAVVCALAGVAAMPLDDAKSVLTDSINVYDRLEVAQVYLLVWTGACVVAVVLNFRVLTSRRERSLARAATGLDRPADSAPSSSAVTPARHGQRPVSAANRERTRSSAGTGQAALSANDVSPDLPAWGSPVTLARPTTDPVQDLVDVNTASAAQLRTLPGVSRNGARRAVEHRRTVGPFPTLDEFVWVVGIESGDVLRLRERASCSPPLL